MDETNAIKRGEGSVVKVTTTYDDGTQEVRFGYKMASGNIYAIKPHQNERQWRLYPVEGPDFVVLNEEEYKALKELFIGTTKDTEFWSSNEELIDKDKVWSLFEGTKEKHK